MASRYSIEEMMANDGDTLIVDLARETIEPGRSFSEEALTEVIDTLGLWVSTRAMRRWNETNEPPTALMVTIKVEVG